MQCAPELAATWASCGLMALTGQAEQAPLRASRDYLGTLARWSARLRAASAAVGQPVEAPPVLLTERAALLGLRRGGMCSAGGKTRMLATADGYIAVGLARQEDLDCLPAWLGSVDEGDCWETVERAVRLRSSEELVEEGQLLGLPVARLANACAAAGESSMRMTTPGATPTRSVRSRPLVLDFSSLWAGPLCGHLLSRAGARVLKVESTRRPDGARAAPAFFNLLHEGQEMLALDFQSADDIAILRRLLLRADIVIEASRPRAFLQLGLDPAEFLRSRPGLTWTSITAHGRQGPRSNWVGFGDDVAVAAGLVEHDAQGRPCFIGDAIADPLTGIAAAMVTLEAHLLGGGCLLDVAMVRVASMFAGAPPLSAARNEQAVQPPQARQSANAAAECGAHTRALLQEMAP